MNPQEDGENGGMRKTSELTRGNILRQKLDGAIIPKDIMMRIGSMISKLRRIIRIQRRYGGLQIWCLSMEYQKILRFNTKGVDVVNMTYLDCVSDT